MHVARSPGIFGGEPKKALLRKLQKKQWTYYESYFKAERPTTATTEKKIHPSQLMKGVFHADL